MIDTEVIENIEIQGKLNLQDIRSFLLNQLNQTNFSSSAKIQRIEMPIDKYHQMVGTAIYK